MWRVDMTAGQRGPEHTFDVEQVWTVVSGGADVELDGETHAIAPGDTLVLPAGAVRRIAATAAGFAALVATRAGARAALTDGTDKATPPWIA
jgi:quercetin dioxygenase-like cupin family protein